VLCRLLIAEFHTLSATTLELEGLSPEFVKKLPRYPRLPATLLGRVAQRSNSKGKALAIC